MRFRIIEIPVCLRHRIGTVVVDHVSLLVQEVIAVLAEPEEAVDVTGHTCALDHELERIRCKPRRMRNQRLAGTNRILQAPELRSRLLLRSDSEGGDRLSVNTDLVAWVDVEFAAIFPTTREERHGVGGQPQLLRPLTGLHQLPHDTFEINVRHFERRNGEQHVGGPFI